jgi:hypothetical protein
MEAAVLRCDLKAVRALLADGRSDPAANNSFALVEAAALGYVGIVRAFLADGRADPAADHNFALVEAAACGFSGTVGALLADGRIDPRADDSAALQHAAHFGCADIVCALLADGRADPAAAVVIARNTGNTVVSRAIEAAVRWRRRRPWLRAIAMYSARGG